MASVRIEPANLGTKGQHATSRPPKPLSLVELYIIKTHGACIKTGISVFCPRIEFNSSNESLKNDYFSAEQ